MKIDRALQNELLELAAEAFPEAAEPSNDLIEKHGAKQLGGTLLYLAQHGLLNTGTQVGLGGYISLGYFEITNRGLDFLADDGGLSAVLGVVTIKLHGDSIKEILIARIEASDETASVKGELIKQVKALPAEGLKTLTTTALTAALPHLPQAMHLLHTWMSSL